MPQGAPASQTTPKSKSGSTVTSTLSKRATDVQKALELNNMFIDDVNAYAQYPELDVQVQSILGHRESALKPEQQRALAQIRKDYEAGVEQTFLVNFMTKLIADKRLAKVSELAEPTREDKLWIERAWDMERLRTSWMAPLRKEALPRLETTDKVIKAILDKVPRVTNPTPDMTFGLHADAFTGLDIVINRKYIDCVEACPDSVHSWFILECKTNGSPFDARNQACRGGAALVQARRQFNTMAEPVVEEARQPLFGHDSSENDSGRQEHVQAGTAPAPSQRTVDLASIAFSMVLTPMVAITYVHWAESEGKKVVRYHMNMVRDHSISSPMGTNLGDLKRDIDNILDWGTLGRKREIADVLKTIKGNANALEGGVFEERKVNDIDEPSATKKSKHIKIQVCCDASCYTILLVGRSHQSNNPDLFRLEKSQDAKN